MVIHVHVGFRVSLTCALYMLYRYMYLHVSILFRIIMMIIIWCSSHACTWFRLHEGKRVFNLYSINYNLYKIWTPQNWGGIKHVSINLYSINYNQYKIWTPQNWGRIYGVPGVIILFCRGKENFPEDTPKKRNFRHKNNLGSWYAEASWINNVIGKHGKRHHRDDQG